MIESDQHAIHTTPSLQDPNLPSPTLHPTWSTAASAVAHTVRITHIPNHTELLEAGAPETNGKYSNTGYNSDQDQPLHENGIHHQLASAYYDAAAMAPLNPFSKVSLACQAHASLLLPILPNYNPPRMYQSLGPCRSSLALVTLHAGRGISNHHGEPQTPHDIWG